MQVSMLALIQVTLDSLKEVIDALSSDTIADPIINYNYLFLQSNMFTVICTVV